MEIQDSLGAAWHQLRAAVDGQTGRALMTGLMSLVCIVHP